MKLIAHYHNPDQERADPSSLSESHQIEAKGYRAAKVNANACAKSSIANTSGPSFE